jgi:hypothetical protein
MNRLGWVLAATISLLVIAAAAEIIRAGPLDPPGPPASTYKSLELIPGSWVLTLDATNGDGQGCGSRRFACVLGGQAVLDVETGLVWQRDGGTIASTWATAVSTCYGQYLGGKWGWRLPTFPELMSLASGVTATVTAGAPFTNVGAGGPGGSLYWTSSVDQANAAQAWAVSWGFAVLPFAKSGPAGATGKVLCVRAGESMATN